MESLAPELEAAFDSHMRDIYSDYFAASNSRYLPGPRGVHPLGSGADYHYRSEIDYFRMVERSRHFDRDNMIVSGGVNKLVANVLQDGFTLDPNTGDVELDKDLAAEWKEWAESPDACDYEGEHSFCDFEQLTLRNVIVDGDVVILPTTEGKLQAVENHRLRNPHGKPTDRCIHGVELDASRRRVKYWLTPEDLNPTQQVRRGTEFRGYPARDARGRRMVWHLFMGRRLSQTRGVTAFAPSVVPVSYHDDLQFAMMVKAKVASFYAIFRQRPSEEALPPRDRRRGVRTEESQSDGHLRTTERLSPGAEVIGDPGEQLQGFSPNIPNPEYFEHAHLILTLIAINLDLPLAVLLLDPSNTNFSGWRGAIDQARMRFRTIQCWQRRRFHEPVYRWRVERRLAVDPVLRSMATRSGINVFGHKWYPPTWPYIEPAKDAMADQLRVTANLTSQRRRAHERGIDWDDLAKEIVQDRVLLARLAIEAADQLNAEFPEAKITWRELAYSYGFQSGNLPMSFAQMIEDEPPAQPAPSPTKTTPAR